MAIRIEGVEELLKRIETIAQAEAMRGALNNACLMVETTAREKAPKDTGALRRSIESKVESNGGEMRGIVFTPLEYAPYVEYGTGIFAEGGGRQDVPWNYQDDEGNWHSTSGQHPKPFMRPALDENREEILRMLKEALLND